MRPHPPPVRRFVVEHPNKEEKNMRNARKWLSLLLALALVFACLPQMTLPAQAAE